MHNHTLASLLQCTAVVLLAPRVSSWHSQTIILYLHQCHFSSTCFQGACRDRQHPGSYAPPIADKSLWTTGPHRRDDRDTVWEKRCQSGVCKCTYNTCACCVQPPIQNLSLGHHKDKKPIPLRSGWQCRLPPQRHLWNEHFLYLLQELGQYSYITLKNMGSGAYEAVHVCVICYVYPN